MILTEAPGEYDIHMELSLEGQALALDASFDVIDHAQNSCAVADVGSRDGGGRSTLVAALGLIFGAAARRARRATTRHRTGDKKTSSGT